MCSVVCKKFGQIKNNFFFGTTIKKNLHFSYTQQIKLHISNYTQIFFLVTYSKGNADTSAELKPKTSMEAQTITTLRCEC